MANEVNPPGVRRHLNRRWFGAHPSPVSGSTNERVPEGRTGQRRELDEYPQSRIDPACRWWLTAYLVGGEGQGGNHIRAVSDRDLGVPSLSSGPGCETNVGEGGWRVTCYTLATLA